jgi:hypothetical protein
VRNRFIPALVAALTGLLLCPLSVAAQTDSQEPTNSQESTNSSGPTDSSRPTDSREPTDPRGPTIFGGPPATGIGPNLNLTLNLLEGYDQDVSEQLAATSQAPGNRGSYTTLVPQLEFRAGSRRAGIYVTSGSNVRYYGDLNKTLVTNQSDGIGLSLQLTPHTLFNVNQGVSYSQDLFYGLFPGSSSPLAVDTSRSASTYDASTKRSLAYTGNASITQKLSERASLVFDADLGYEHFTGLDSVFADLRTRGADGHLQYSLSKSLRLRVGYRLKRGQYVGTPATNEHDLDFGFDYTRPWSRTRKTTISFTLAPSVTNGTLVSGAIDLQRQYKVIGDAAIVHQIGRTWNVSANYRRAAGYYVEGVQSRIFTEAYSAGMNGLLSRRTDLSVSTGYSTGQPELTTQAAAFSTYTANVRLRFALGRTWATYGEYVFYYYRFDQGFQLPTGVPPQFTRNGVKGGLTLWLPMMRNR